MMPLAFIIEFILLLGPLGAGASKLCSAVHNANGTTSFFLNESLPLCTYYNWRINKIVRANEENYTRTLIESRGPNYITFYGCHENVTFRNICTPTVVDCSSPCPTEESLTTLSPVQGQSSPNEVDPAAVTGGIFGVLAFIGLCIVAVLVWRNRELLNRCLCRLDYEAAKQDASDDRQL